MHHLTTLDLPTPTSKDAERQMLAAWLAEAGVDEAQITTRPIEDRPASGGQWVSKPITSPEKREQLASRYAAPTSLALITQMRSLANQGFTQNGAARALKIGTARAKRIAQEHGITFAVGRGGAKA